MESPFACFFSQKSEKINRKRFSAAIHARALHEQQAVGYTTRKGVLLMRITLHIGRFTVTIIVKSRNRHSAK